MPGKIRYGRGRSKRKGGKKPTVTIELPPNYRPRSASSLQRMQGVPNFLPKERTVSLRYTTQHTLTSASGLLTNRQYRANGCYDPDITGIGHQPYGWDQMVQFYNHYVVLGAKISVTVVPQTENTSFAGVIGLYLSDDQTHGFTTYTTFIEAGKGTWKLINGGSSKPETISCKYSAKKFFNLKDVKDNVPRIGASTNADPGELAVYNLFYQAADEASTATNVQVLVNIDYIVAFSEPKDIAAS